MDFHQTYVTERKNTHAIIRFKMKQDLGPGESFK